MKTLLECIDEALLKLDFDFSIKSVKNIISSNESCAEFIRVILRDEEFALPGKESHLYRFDKVRASHVVVTFLMGIAFSEFAQFNNRIRVKILTRIRKTSRSASVGDINKEFFHLWMVTSLYHDYGYFSKYVERRNLKLKKAVRYYLLDDYYEDKKLAILSGFSNKFADTMAFSYEEIEAYDKFARKFHDKNHSEEDPERIDHGILGGVLIFDRLIHAALKQNDSNQNNECISAKVSCITIAQHNIYKSQKKEDDIKYGEELKKLHHDSGFIIDTRTPLLLLLCLVDTVECVKRLGTGEIGAGAFLAKTLLENISLELSDDYILIDYSELEKRIEKKKKTGYEKIKNEFERYKNALSNLKTWTQLSASIEGSMAKIVLKSENENSLAASKMVGGEMYHA